MAKLPPQIKHMTTDEITAEISLRLKLIGSNSNLTTDEDFDRLEALAEESVQRVRRLLSHQEHQTRRQENWRLAAAVTIVIVISVVAVLIPIFLAGGL